MTVGVEPVSDGPVTDDPVAGAAGTAAAGVDPAGPVGNGTGAVLDRPDVVAQVRAAFTRYEAALVDGDVAVLTELFWDDPRCVRYGVADRQHGAAEIAAWRRDHPSVPPGRRLRGTVVVAVDERTAVVSTLFDHPDRAVEGRQTQTWARLADGWRIVAAHVSELPLAS